MMCSQENRMMKTLIVGGTGLSGGVTALLLRDRGFDALVFAAVEAFSSP